MKISTILRHGYMLLNDNIKKQLTRVDDSDDGEDENGDDGMIIRELVTVSLE